MRWFSLRRAETKHVTVRLQAELAQRLVDRARLEDKTSTDVITEALEDYLSVPSATMEQSDVTRAARQIKQSELQVERLEREEAYRDARQRLHVANAPGALQWFKNEMSVTKAEAEKGVYSYGDNRYRITPAEYDQWVKDKAVNAAVVADYANRIRVLKDKIDTLKAEIVKSNVSHNT